ncbi:unnamed protein product, partial [Ectocarpus sp. 12 AP-2014]
MKTCPVSSAQVAGDGAGARGDDGGALGAPPTEGRGRGGSHQPTGRPSKPGAALGQ